MVSVTMIFPWVATLSLNRSWVLWIELLTASKSGCIASAALVGLGSRSILLTKFVFNDGIYFPRLISLT